MAGVTDPSCCLCGEREKDELGTSKTTTTVEVLLSNLNDQNFFFDIYPLSLEQAYAADMPSCACL